MELLNISWSAASGPKVPYGTPLLHESVYNDVIRNGWDREACHGPYYLGSMSRDFMLSGIIVKIASTELYPKEEIYRDYDNSNSSIASFIRGEHKTWKESFASDQIRNYNNRYNASYSDVLDMLEERSWI